MSVERLRFATTLLARLGEELNPNPDQGILELVRNAYDAGARNCSIELIDTHAPGGTIRIRDDGVGMTPEDIREGWLVVGRSKKNATRKTYLGRYPVGSKGLGRLAALRLGQTVKLRSWPKGAPATSYHLDIDWDDFDNADTVDDVALELRSLKRKRTEERGTSIEIGNLKDKLGRREVKRLARSLVLLADPFESETSFKPVLQGSEFEDLERLVSEKYFSEAEFHLCAEVRKGEATAKLLDYQGQTLFSATHAELTGEGSGEPYETPDAAFDLWAFILAKNNFTTRTATLGEVKEWLSVVGGIHLYHRGLRVAPYGDAGHDWLDINLQRVRNPELRPSTNTSIGIVKVTDPRAILVQKTDRSGFIEDDAFAELRRFATGALEWMARRRLQIRESKRTSQRVEAPGKVARARKELQETVHHVPPKQRGQVEQAIARYEKAQDEEKDRLRDELQLYRTLSTVGTTAATFAHESRNPVSRITDMAKTIERRGKRHFSAAYNEQLERPVELILRAAASISVFSRTTLSLLEKQKRRRGHIEINEIVTATIDLFAPFLKEGKVEVELLLAETKLVFFGSIASLESILANLLTNAMNAFARKDAPDRPRKIRVVTQREDAGASLRFLDNGPGIRELSLKEIWLPGQTSLAGGTGIGLTIVKDAVKDLGGSIEAIVAGELGGAEFTIHLPLLE